MSAPTYTKAELVKKLAAGMAVSNDVAENCVEVALNAISEALLAGKRVEFRNFGVFEVVVRQPKLGRNPKKPTVTYLIPSRKTVRFKAGKWLAMSVDEHA